MHAWESEVQRGDRSTWGLGHPQACRPSSEGVVRGQERWLQGGWPEKPRLSDLQCSVTCPLAAPGLSWVHSSTPAEGIPLPANYDWSQKLDRDQTKGQG